MTNRRIEMHHYRDILVRMRFGQSSRQLAKQRIIGRRKAQQIKDIAEVNGWLDPKIPLPDNAILAKAFMANEPKPSTTSLVEPYRKSVEDWVEQGVLATRIHQVLVSSITCGSYSSVQRFVKQLAAETPAIRQSSTLSRVIQLKLILVWVQELSIVIPVNSEKHGCL